MPTIRSRVKPKPPKPQPPLRGTAAAARQRLLTQPVQRSTEEQRALVEERRIRRELALMKRIATLTRQLSRATYDADDRVFTLGRTICVERGWVVMKKSALAEYDAELDRLRKDGKELHEAFVAMESDEAAGREEIKRLRAQLADIEANTVVRSSV